MKQTQMECLHACVAHIMMMVPDLIAAFTRILFKVTAFLVVAGQSSTSAFLVTDKT